MRPKLIRVHESGGGRDFSKRIKRIAVIIVNPIRLIVDIKPAE
jgi:hypothetical protein